MAVAVAARHLSPFGAVARMNAQGWIGDRAVQMSQRLAPGGNLTREVSLQDNRSQSQRLVPRERSSRIRSLMSTLVAGLALQIASPSYAQLGQAKMGIYRMRPDGTGQQFLVQVGDRFHHGSPSWSPDGKQIAFDAYERGLRSPKICLCKSDGSELRELTAGAYPNWSPDGRQLIYFSGLFESDLDVLAIHVDGSNQRRLTDGGFPHWSPDGQWVLFARAAPNQGIWKIRPDGTGLTSVRSGTGPCLGTVWSPDGKRIAFSAGELDRFHLFTMKADGSNVQRLAQSADRELFPKWSPDGKKICYVQYDIMMTDGDVHVVSADGTGRSAIASAPGYQIDPVFSPDGKWLAYAAQQ